MAKEIVSQTRYVCGFEAPRNSLEVPLETPYDIYSLRDNILYAYHVTKEETKNNSYSTEAPVKKLISEEIVRQPTSKKSSPNVIARLMGVDMAPLDSKAPKQSVIKTESPPSKLLERDRSKRGSVRHDEFNFISYNSDIYSDQSNGYMKSNKPKPREHPQEEELQKFKKEFEAWQTARFKECTKVAEFDGYPSQLIAQEALHREKMYLTVNSKRVATNDNLMNFDQKHNIASAPTKIVLLRPGPERAETSENSWSTPSTSDERGGSIKDFLEEVKERLNSELQGKSYSRSSSFRGGGIETPYREKRPSDPREIDQHIAQQMGLLRSESTRSYKSDIQLEGVNSPAFISKDTRKFLTEKLRNVLKDETCNEHSRNSSRSSLSDFHKSRFGQLKDIRTGRKLESNAFVMTQEVSPRNLIRSMSAPVSGNSFQKLLLEDRHILAGAEIKMKHEVVKNIPMYVKKQKKDKFNIREKVSSFRYSLTHRRLFHRRVQSVDGSYRKKNDLFKDFSNGPTVMMNFFGTNENYTEVPPSPASVCSSVHEDFWRSTDYSSPTSSSGMHQMEDNEMTHGFREISSNLNELRRKLNQLEGDFPVEDIIEQPDELDVDIEDQAEAYIRDLLVASGLYDGSSNRSLSKWDPHGKHISNEVYEEVEESYKLCNDEDQGEKVDHKLLLDLLNEALPSILSKPLVNTSKFMERVTGNVQKPLHGWNLLFRAWEIIKVYVHPPADRFYYTFENVFARDLKCDTWCGVMEYDTSDLARDFECLIIGDLIDDILEDMRS